MSETAPTPLPDDEVPSEFLAAAYKDGKSTMKFGSSFWLKLKGRDSSCGIDLGPEPDEYPATETLTADQIAPDVEGRYRIVGEVAHGGMGVVYRAADGDLGRDVALKVLKGPLVHDPKLLQRFIEEAQVGAQLQHPGIVPVYDVGLLADKRPFFAMKFIRGNTLAALLAERADLTTESARFLSIFAQVAQTLAFAHARSVIHRDVKPANILLGSFGEVMLSDWGLAKVLPRGGLADERRNDSVTVIETTRTRHSEYASEFGSIMGTWAYMSPEQARGEVDRLTPATDVFSLGAILFEILTGQPPFGRGDLATTREAHEASERPAVERKLRKSGADPAIVGLALDCLEFEPTKRPADAVAVAQRVVDHLENAARRARDAEVAAARAATRAEEAERHGLLQRRSRRLTGVAAAFAVLAIAITGETYRRNVLDRSLVRGLALDRLAAIAAEADGLWAEARQTADEAAVQRALEAATRCLAVAEDTLVPPEVKAPLLAKKAAVEAALGELRLQAIAATRRAALVDEIERIRLLPGEDWDWARQSAAYERIFRENLIDVAEASLGEAEAAVRRHPEAARLTKALESWHLASARFDDARSPVAAKVGSLIAALVKDSWWQRLATARREKNVEALKALCTETPHATLDAARAEALGSALGFAGAVEAAVDWLREARRRHPEDFWTLVWLGRFLSELPTADYEEAVACYSAALAVRPKSGSVLDLLGAALVYSGRAEEAKRTWQRILAENPKAAAARVHLAALDIDFGDWEKGGRTLDEVLAEDENNLKARHFRGVALAASGDLAAVEAWYADLIERCRKRRERSRLFDTEILGIAHDQLANAQLRLNKTAAAIENLKTALALRPHDAAKLNFNLAVAWLKADDQQQALACARIATGNEKFSAGAWSLVAAIEQAQGRKAEALATLRKGIALSTNHPLLCADLGARLLEVGDAFEARRHLEIAAQAIRSGDKRVFDAAPSGFVRDTLMNLATCYRGLGLRRDKRAVLEDIVARHAPGDADALLELGESAIADDDHATAESCLRKAMSARPKDQRATLLHAKALAALGRSNEAIGELELAASSGGAAAKDAWRELGKVRFAEGDWSGAEAAYLRCIELEQGDAAAIFGLAKIDRIRGRPARAAARLAGTKATASLQIEIDAFLAETALERGLFKAGIDGYHMIYGQGYESFEFRRAHANALASIGEYESALNTLDYACRAYPGDPSPWIDRTRIRLVLGQFEAAKTDFEKATELAVASTAKTRELKALGTALAALDEARRWENDHAVGARIPDDVELARACLSLGKPGESLSAWIDAAKGETVRSSGEVDELLFEAALAATKALKAAKDAAAAEVVVTTVIGWVDASRLRAASRLDQPNLDLRYAALRHVRRLLLHRSFAIFRRKDLLAETPTSASAIVELRKLWDRVSQFEAELVDRTDDDGGRK